VGPERPIARIHARTSEAAQAAAAAIRAAVRIANVAPAALPTIVDRVRA
jgi:thymidine phosphorylase